MKVTRWRAENAWTKLLSMLNVETVNEKYLNKKSIYSVLFNAIGRQRWITLK